jgi:hypothetical protein
MFDVAGAVPSPSKSPLKQQTPPPPAAGFSCQTHASFVVWPQPDKTSLERRTSMPMGPGPAGPTAAAAGGPGSNAAAAGVGGAAGGVGAAAAGGAPAAVSSLMEGLQDVEQIDYKLGMQALKLRWEVSLCGAVAVLPIGLSQIYRIRAQQSILERFWGCCTGIWEGCEALYSPPFRLNQQRCPHCSSGVSGRRCGSGMTSCFVSPAPEVGTVDLEVGESLMLCAMAARCLGGAMPAPDYLML